MREYSADIADAIRNMFNDSGWHYRWDEDNGVAHYSIQLKGRLNSADAILSVGRDSFTTYTICPISASPSDPDQMSRMAEFLTRANYGLTYGNYELDYRDGEIRYKFTADCDGILPSEAILEDTLHIPARMLDRYGDGIVKVLYGLLTPKEAAKECDETWRTQH